MALVEEDQWTPCRAAMAAHNFCGENIELIGPAFVLNPSGLHQERSPSLFPDALHRHSQHQWPLSPCVTSDHASPSMSAESAEDLRAVGVDAAVSVEQAGDATPQKKKQKRNKPTLSCEECVERKTKVRVSKLIPPEHYAALAYAQRSDRIPAQCDRVRPSCLACVKRQTPCKFSDVANVIAAR